MAEKESQKKQQYGMVQELLRESNRLREELHNLKCLRQIKAEERGQKHRELLRTEVRTQIHLRLVHHMLFLISLYVKHQKGHRNKLGKTSFSQKLYWKKIVNEANTTKKNSKILAKSKK